MSSFFSCIGQSIRDAAPPPPRRTQNRGGFLARAITGLAALAVVGGQVDPTTLGQAVLQSSCILPDEASWNGPKKRTCYLKVDVQKLATDAIAFRDRARAQKIRYWRKEFITERWGALTGRELKAKHNQLRAALLQYRKTGETWKQRLSASDKMKRSRTETRNTGTPAVIPSLRKKAPHPRKRLCEELDEEVWHWYVDRLATNKTRVTTEELIGTADMYKAAIMEKWRLDCEAGLADVGAPPKLPKTTVESGWPTRWRFRYGVTIRTVNLRYKVSYEKFVGRLRVFWTNCIKVRALFEEFHPGVPLEFVGFDQKPLWFNATTNEKTLAPKGQRKTGTAENVSASRARFTGMTQCRSGLVGACSAQPVGGGRTDLEEAPCIGILFKIGEAASSLANLRRSLLAKATTLIQGAPRGSYRLAQVLEFLRWAVKPAEAVAETKIIVLDWFAPHLDPAVDNLLHDMGHAVLRIGGGLTALVQVEDTHAHRPYNNHYRSLEKRAASSQWDLAPGLPCCSKQTVLTRAEDAWGLVDHHKCRRGWWDDGIALPLDGKADGALSSQVAQYWVELGMETVRANAIQDIKDAVATGDITAFSQYHKVLETYDDHEPIREGMEGASAYVYDESGAHAPIGDTGENEVDEDEMDEDEAAIEEKVDADEAAIEQEHDDAGGLGVEALPLDMAGAGSGLATEGGLVPGTGLAPERDAGPGNFQTAAEAEARLDLQGSVGEGVVAAYAEAEAALRARGEHGVADYLAGEIRTKLRRRDRADNPLSLLLRARTLQRKRAMEEARAQAAKDRVALEACNKRLKIAKDERLAASHKSKGEKAIAKAKEAELKAARDGAKELQRNAKAAVDHLRRTFASKLARGIDRFFASASQGQAFLSNSIAQRLYTSTVHLLFMGLSQTSKGRVQAAVEFYYPPHVGLNLARV